MVKHRNRAAINANTAKRQAKIYGYILAYAAEHDGLPPHVRDVQDWGGFDSSCSPGLYLKRLREAGALAMLPGGRRYRIVGASWAGPVLPSWAALPDWALPMIYKVLKYMIAYKVETAGISPTTREISEHLGVNSSSAVHAAWQGLLAQGWLIPAGRSVGWLIKGGKWSPPSSEIVAKYSGKAGRE